MINSESAGNFGSSTGSSFAPALRIASSALAYESFASPVAPSNSVLTNPIRILSMLLAGGQLNAASVTVRSRPSGPCIACKTAAQSSTLRQMGPILSIVQQSAIAPYRLTRPNVGLSPVTPQVEEGDTIEPRVSVPIENPTSPAAVAAAGPADDPLEL